MNERIKELTAQLGEPSTWGAERPVGPGFAGSRWSGWSDVQQEIRGYNTPLYDTAQLATFAELIVRECIQQLRYKSAQLVDVDYFPEYKEQLEKHFGVH